jgi:lysophospholipase L1-like esterase
MTQPRDGAGRRRIGAVRAAFVMYLTAGCASCRAVLDRSMAVATSMAIRIPLMAAVSAGLLSACAAGGDLASPGGQHWLASWGTAQMVMDHDNALAQSQWTDSTLRQVVRVSLPGRSLRVRISNAFGTSPLLVDAASVALAAGPGRADALPASLHALRFGGKRMASIPAGAELASDPVELPHAVNADLAISMHFTQAPARQSGHPGSRATSFVLAGNRVLDAAWPHADSVARWYQLAGVEVLAAPGARSLVAIGDSITDGYGVRADTNARWTDFLAARLRAARMNDVGVVNAGIGGGRLLRDGLGPSLVSRFGRDVLERPGVSHAVVLVGVNDLGGQRRSGEDTPAARARLLDEMKQAHRQLVALAHEKGVCVIGATLTPYGGSGYYQPGPESERDRVALNQWIRDSGVFDAVADFDAALRDPARPGTLRKEFDNDGLHPSTAGYRAMAEAFPLAALHSCGAAGAIQRP